MERTKKPENKLVKQMKTKIKNAEKEKTEIKKKKEYDGDTSLMASTGSTLLDLAISGGRVRGGGIPSGIVVEVFGPNSAGKTVLLCEIAGDVQRKGGQIQFQDPEARLNMQFARMFDLDTDKIEYSTPNTVSDVFANVRKWEPKNDKVINGVFADSLAALSTDLEMDNEDGDKMGMKRAKEFSEGFRRVARVISGKNILMVCSNQIRESSDGYGPKYKSPGGMAIGFYASLRLRAGSPEKIWKKKNIAGKEKKKVIGVETEFEVFKSSVWKPYRTASLYILFDYGIDDIRSNLQFIKDNTSNKTYMLGDRTLSNVMEDAIAIIEDEGLELGLKEEVIDLWEEIESKFETERKPKTR